jgi:DNA modification methylase
VSDGQDKLDLGNEQQGGRVEEYKFEPIKGYPMLNWRGKRPFTSTQFYPAQLKEVHGAEVDGWRNKIFWGDNLQVMSHLLQYYRGKIDFVYIDPPFDSKADYSKKIRVKSKNTETYQTNFEEKQYADIWANDEYLQFMYERLVIIRELMSPSATIMVHLDWHKVHHIRCVMDEVFGPKNFVNEIIWHYYNKMQGNINRFASNHDNILWYKKGDNYYFEKIREKREAPITQIKRVWNPESQSLVNARDEDGNVIYIESTHKTIDDVWRMSMLQPADKVEPTGYPTQKPEALMARIIEAAAPPGGLVLDAFAGSGSLLAVASKTNRRFIGADINLGAIQTMTKRLLANQSEIGLESFNVNNYDVFRNPAEAKLLLIEAMEIQPFENHDIFDGEKDGRMVKIMPVNRIATKADLGELVAGFDQKAFQRRQDEKPNQPVERILLVCMGHEPDLKAELELQAKPFRIDVEVVDILRDKSQLEFKRDSQSKLAIRDGELVIESFYPMNLLQKLSLQQEQVGEWRELVDSVMVDWNYDGAVLQPAVVDVPGKDEFVAGRYKVPADAGTIRVKITDLLSESWEGNIDG